MDNALEVRPQRGRRNVVAASSIAITIILTSCAVASNATVNGNDVKNSMGINTVAMPKGSLPGWTEVFSDDFAGTSLNPKEWSEYSGRPVGDPGGFWLPINVEVRSGLLTLQGIKVPQLGNTWITAGVSSGRSLSQTYGKYLVRFRMDPGRGISYVALLWPAKGSGPPEIDFAEDNGAGSRSATYATLHFWQDKARGIRGEKGFMLAENMTQWQTLGVEWTPGKLEYTIDGNVWQTLQSKYVPDVPMVLDLQTQDWSCGTQTWENCPNSTTPGEVNMQVAWVVAYAYTPGSS